MPDRIALQSFFSMDTFKKIIRWTILVFLIVLAASGVGIFGAFLPRSRERYMDNEIKNELVEGREDEKSENKLGDVS